MHENNQVPVPDYLHNLASSPRHFQARYRQGICAFDHTSSPLLPHFTLQLHCLIPARRCHARSAIAGCLNHSGASLRTGGPCASQPLLPINPRNRSSVTATRRLVPHTEFPSSNYIDSFAKYFAAFSKMARSSLSSSFSF